MNLSTTDREEVLHRIAQGLLAEFRQSADMDSLIVIPISMVEQTTGMGKTQIRRRLPVTNLSHRVTGVVLRDLKAYLANNTTAPKA
jgi:hypothetical protein